MDVKNTETGSYYLCDSLLSNKRSASYYYAAPILSEIQTDYSIYHQVHLFNLLNLTGSLNVVKSKVLIAQNTFYNISLMGPVIHIQNNLSNIETAIAIAENNF